MHNVTMCKDVAIDTQCLVTEFDVVPASLPMKKPVPMASSTISEARNVFVRASSGEHDGWGETTDATTTTGESADRILAALRALQDGLCLPLPLARARDLVRAKLRSAPAARSAVLMALLDLEARHQCVPAWRLLGGRELHAQLAMHIVSGATVDEERVDAEQAYAAGVRIFKLKVGRRPLEQELDEIRSITAAIGTEAVWGADANEGLSLEAALTCVERGRGLGLTYLEQPVPRTVLRELAQRAAAFGSGLPVAADESVGTAADVRQLADVVAGVVLKIQKAGGPAGLVAAAAEARRQGMLLGLTGKVAESSLASAALLHASAANGSPEWGLSLTLTSLAVDPVQVPLVRVDGLWLPPAGDGWGVVVDEDQLREYSRS